MEQTAVQQTYDLIVIGAGPVGENVADRAVQGGLSVAVVESELVGGECSYWACMPSKALLRPLAVVAAARRAPGAAEAVSGRIDVGAVLRRRDEVASHWDDAGQVSWLEGAGIALVRGRGALAGPRLVRVAQPGGSSLELTARHAVAVCTGSSALVPDIPGLTESDPWTSRDATSAQDVPARLGILGGGVVAVEMATAFARMGSEVTMVVRDGLLTRMEPFAGELVGQALQDDGVAVLLSATIEQVERHEDGTLSLTLDDGGDLEVDELLVATGRAPRTQGLGLEAVGLADGDWLRVDDTLRVLGPDGEPVDGGWLYAVGDVNHRALLTHQGKYQARAAGDVIVARAAGTPVDDAPWGTHVATADHDAVPQVVFSDPEAAAVGLTAAQAERAGLRTRVVDYDLANIAGSSVHAVGYTGKARMVVDEDRGVVVGVTFVGQDVAELLQSATVAVAGQVPIARLWHAVPAYPTISEVWLRLLEGYGRP